MLDHVLGTAAINLANLFSKKKKKSAVNASIKEFTSQGKPNRSMAALLMADVGFVYSTPWSKTARLEGECLTPR